MEADAQYPIETFDPILRDLVTWQLVVRDESGDGAPWRLAERAERRLDALLTSNAKFAADSLIYFDHICASCRRHAPTRLHQGAYLCEDCWRRERATVSLPAEPEPAAPHRPWLRKRERSEHDPLAS